MVNVIVFLVWKLLNFDKLSIVSEAMQCTTHFWRENTNKKINLKTKTWISNLYMRSDKAFEGTVAIL